jgi:hypothetical protein
MQGGKNWILPKEMNANWFFWDSHWLEIWSNHFVPLWDRMEGALQWTQNLDSRHLELQMILEVSGIVVSLPSFSL